MADRLGRVIGWGVKPSSQKVPGFLIWRTVLGYSLGVLRQEPYESPIERV